MDISRYKEIKNELDNLKGIAHIKFLLNLSEKERTDFFNYKKFLETQHFLLGGTDYE